MVPLRQANQCALVLCRIFTYRQIQCDHIKSFLQIVELLKQMSLSWITNEMFSVTGQK
jgi:hypothetical protein